MPVPHDPNLSLWRCAQAGCIRCRAADARRHRELRRQPALVDAAPVIAHVEQVCAATGASWRTVAYHAGICDRAVSRLLSPTRRPGKVRRETATALLLVPASELGAGYRPLRTNRPARPTVRKLEGLFAQGWTAAEIGRRTGLLPYHLSRKIRRASSVHGSTADRIDRLAAEIGNRQGPCRRLAADAARRGWLPLKWGTDEDIAELCGYYRCRPVDLPALAAREAAGRPADCGRAVAERRSRVRELRAKRCTMLQIAVELVVPVTTVEADLRRIRHADAKNVVREGQAA